MPKRRTEIAPRAFRIKRYKSIRSILAAMYRIKENELDDYVFYYETQGDTRTSTGGIGVLCESIEAMQVFGFTDDKDSNLIHTWRGPKLKLAEWVFFLGHEIGHRHGIAIKQRRLKSYLEEETRADSYGQVAVQVMNLINKER